MNLQHIRLHRSIQTQRSKCCPVPFTWYARRGTGHLWLQKAAQSSPRGWAGALNIKNLSGMMKSLKS